MGTLASVRYKVGVELVVAMREGYEFNRPWLRSIVDMAIDAEKWYVDAFTAPKPQLLENREYSVSDTPGDDDGNRFRLFTTEVSAPFSYSQEVAFGFRGWGHRVKERIAKLVPPTDDFVAVDALLNMCELPTFATRPADMHP